MTRTSSRPRRAARRRRGQPDSKAALYVLGLLLVAAVVAAAYTTYRHDALLQWRQSLTEGGTPTAWPPWNPTWPPLPKPPAERITVTGDLSGPYAYAAVNKELLRGIPCYCGCWRIDHRSNLDCYVRSFAADDTPSWTDHSFTCAMCVNITHEVSLLRRQGTSARAIRESIDEHYAGWFRRPTRTPPPPDSTTEQR